MCPVTCTVAQSFQAQPLATLLAPCFSPPPIYNSAAITVIDDEGPPLALGFLQPVLSGFVYIIFVICSFCAWDQPVCVQLLLAVAMSLRLQYTWTNWHYLM